MPDYALALSDAEVKRYLWLAEQAKNFEADLWKLAGIGPGALIADVGCGPAAVSVAMSRTVGPNGRVIGVDRDELALSAARQVVKESGASNVELKSGTATSTGLEPGHFDVVVLRHVLGHNGGKEQEIVSHLASLVRPGGVVYLVDTDSTLTRTLDMDPELSDLNARYNEFQSGAGNDVSVGLRLGKFISAAGLDLVRHVGIFQIVSGAAGVRPPAWAAREKMLAGGYITSQDVQRWQSAFERLDKQAQRPTIFIPIFVGVGRLGT